MDPALDSSETSILKRIDEQCVILPYPPTSYLTLLLPDEVTQAVSTYLNTVTFFLRLSRDDFTIASDVSSHQGSQMISFLTAYVNQRTDDIPTLSSPTLDKKIFDLIFRFVSEGRDISSSIDSRFILNVTRHWYYSHQLEVAALLARLWRRAKAKMLQEFSQLRDHYTSSFELIVIDDTRETWATLTGLRYMVSLNIEIVDLLVEGGGGFIESLHGLYNVYRTQFALDERLALLYFLYTVILSLAYRASDSSLGQSKKGKGPSGSSEALFFQVFDKIFSHPIREGRWDGFVEDINRETPFVEVITEWSEQWKGADETVEGLTSYLGHLRLSESTLQNEVTFTEGEV
jgi:hypothetical protein